MTDEGLIKWLRNLHPADYELRHCILQTKAADRIEELSDKLAKAVAELEDHLHCHDCTCGPCEQIRETLAELGEGT